MVGEITFSKLKSKQHAELYVQLVFQITIFDFIFSHKNTFYNVDRLIKNPEVASFHFFNFSLLKVLILLYVLIPGARSACFGLSRLVSRLRATASTATRDHTVFSRRWIMHAETVDPTQLQCSLRWITVRHSVCVLCDKKRGWPTSRGCARCGRSVIPPCLWNSACWRDLVASPLSFTLLSPSAALSARFLPGLTDWEHEKLRLFLRPVAEWLMEPQDYPFTPELSAFDK